jgi:hypothetical protein
VTCRQVCLTRSLLICHLFSQQPQSQPQRQRPRPSGPKFLYQPVRGEQVVLLDIATGQSQVIISEAFQCVSLSTDGSRFSAVENHELRIYDLSGNYQTIDSAPSALYSPLPGVPDSGSPVFASIECGQWLSPNQLIFHRFTGVMPNQLENGDIPVNTTTLVDLQAEPVLQDTADLWTIVDICADGSQKLLVNRDRELFVAEEIKTVGNFKDRPLNLSLSGMAVAGHVGPYAGFMNAECNIYYRAESEPRAVHVIESQTLTDRIVYTVPPTKLPTSWEAVWFELDNNRLMPLIGTAGTSTADPFYLYIANLETGEHVQIGEFTDVAPMWVLAWLP